LHFSFAVVGDLNSSNDNEKCNMANGKWKMIFHIQTSILVFLTAFSAWV